MKQTSLIVFIIVAFIASCTSSRLCTYHSKYLRTDIDTTKEYKLKGAYCVASIKDTVLGEVDNCIVKFNVFDRIKGRQVVDGVIYFYGRDTTTIIFNSTTYQKVIKAGDYIVEAWASRYIGTKTKKFTISRNKKIEINFYLGTTVDF